VRPVSTASGDTDSARRALMEWAANDRRRDDVVRAALAAGVTKTEIHRLTGIARSTIDRIKERERKMSAHGTVSKHEFTPWVFGTESTPLRWVRHCTTCPPERPHCEVSASPLPPPGALAEMPLWQLSLAEHMTAADWIAAAEHGKIRVNRGTADWLNR